MAWYEISAAPLADAGDKIQSFANDLTAIRERLESLFSGLQGSLRGFQQQKNISSKISELCISGGNIGRKLTEITEIYANAERLVFDGEDSAGEKHALSPGAAPPIIKSSSSVLLFNDLIMPDWLQAAVIKYEQSQKQ